MITADGHRNKQNDRYVTTSPELVEPIWRSKKPSSAMALGVLGSDGKLNFLTMKTTFSKIIFNFAGSKMPLHWIQMKKGKRGMNQDHYIEILEEVVLPWIRSTYDANDVIWCFQQVRM